jgi:hypothetical protein
MEKPQPISNRVVFAHERRKTFRMANPGPKRTEQIVKEQMKTCGRHLAEPEQPESQR